MTKQYNMCDNEKRAYTSMTTRVNLPQACMSSPRRADILLYYIIVRAVLYTHDYITCIRIILSHPYAVLTNV